MNDFGSVFAGSPGRRTVACMNKLIASIAAAAALAGCGSSDHPKPPAKPRFTAAVDNTWFPLPPGTRWVYRGVKDGKPSRDVVTVGHATRMIQGVPCAVVTDMLYEKGKLEERTTDWYSQDSAGNVWYYGEQTAELYPDGRVKNTSGTWQAGVRGGVDAGGGGEECVGRGGGGGARGSGRDLHARKPARRPDWPAGVLQGPG